MYTSRRAEFTRGRLVRVTTLTDQIKRLIAAADRDHSKVDERLARQIHELTAAEFGELLDVGVTMPPTDRVHVQVSRNGTTPAGKGETADAIREALTGGRLKLADLAQQIEKTKSNTYNSVMRLVRKGIVIKTDDAYYQLASQRTHEEGPAREAVSSVSPVTEG